MTDTVLLEINKTIATITLNRPEAMNAYNSEMSEKLALIIQEVADNSSIRAVILRGAGPLFMAGGDIRFFYEQIHDLSASLKKIMRELYTSIIGLQTMDKPVLAVVHGSVAGVGLSLMLACDLVIAAADTKFTTAYSKIGLSPDGGASYFLPRIVGTKKAMELFMTADIFSAEEAKKLGLLNWVVPQDQLAEHSQQIIQGLANGPTRALAAAKTLVNQSVETALQHQFLAEAKYFSDCAESNDFKTGVTAFIKKTKPEFTGN